MSLKRFPKCLYLLNMSMTYPSLEGGKLLPLVESFYTIQGEGFHSGKPAYFIRLGGCDVGCRWCDSKESWNPDRFPPVPIEDIVRDAVATPAKAIVITGGEPMNYPLDPLCMLLKQSGMEIYVETSGSSHLSGIFDWVCLSPKRNKPPKDEFFMVADELKVIIEDEKDFEWAEENRIKVLRVQTSLSGRSKKSLAESGLEVESVVESDGNTAEALTKVGFEGQIGRYADLRKAVDGPCLFYMQPEWSKMKVISPLIVEYVKKHPEWNISIQAHKFLNIP